MGLGKRICNPSSDHHLNDHHLNDHHHGRANDNDHCCANDHYDNHNYYDDHKHGCANDKYFFICPIGEVLQLFWLIY